MKPLNKKSVIIATLIFIVVIVIFMVTRKSSNEAIGKPTPTPPPDLVKEVIPAPNIHETYDKFVLPIVFDLKEWNIPAYIDLYTVNNTAMSENQIKTIASLFQFTTSPIIGDDSYLKTKVYLYSKEKQTLIIYPDIQKISYSNHANDISKPIDPNKQVNIEKIIKEYLSTRVFAPLSINPEIFKPDVIKTMYKGDEQEGAQNQKANINTIRFVTTTPNNYPIVGMSYNLGSLFGEINADDQITKIELDSVTDIGRTGQVKLYSQEEAAKAAPYNAVIQTIDGIYEGDISQTALKKITITGVRLVYLKEQTGQQKYLQPVIDMNGIATLSNGASRSINMYLRATSPL
jgi:hypothetical protein